MIDRLVAIIVGMSCAASSAAGPMVDPAIDDLDRPWCYLAQSTTLVGVPYMPDAVQVTFDGAIYTGHAELCLFSGDPLTPILPRQKTWLDGWIPIVQYDWRDGDVAYDVEMFGAVLDGQDETNTLQFARVRIRNTGRSPAKASLAAATRTTGVVRRLRGGHFSPTWRYEMTDDCLLRDGRLVYCYPSGARREAVPGEVYEKAFVGSRYKVTSRAEVGLTRYECQLKPGEAKSLVFKMPRVPVEASDEVLIAKIRTADYAAYREKTVEYWTKRVGTACRISLPEARVEHAHRACAVHAMLATRQRGGERFQTDGLPYPNFFMLTLFDYQMLYDSLGQHEVFRNNVPQYRKRQLEDGLFYDSSLMHGRKLLSSHGPTLLSLTHHTVMTRDVDFGRSVWPMVRKAVACIEADHKSDPKGLMRPSWPYDAEMIRGYYTSHNLWCLAALRSAIRVARLLGEADDVRAWTALHDGYEAAVLRAIDASAHPDGYVPTGLFEFITGPKARAGMAEYQTDQDWENALLAWPTEVLDPLDPRVAGTYRRLRTTKYREGIMTYRNGQHLHQYLTVKPAMQAVVAGDQRAALEDVYHILLHSGSTFEGFENLVTPWGDRNTWASCPPPHGWGAAKVALMLRSLMVMERGGRGGLDEDRRDLWLFSLISPAWAKAGETVAVNDAPTEMGTVSAAMAFRDGGADVVIDADFHHPPRHICVRIPYFVNLTGYETDAEHATLKDGSIRLGPDASRLTLQWQPIPDVHNDTFQRLLLRYRREPEFWPGRRDQMPPLPVGSLTQGEAAHAPQPLSFAAVRDTYRHEYRVRYDKYLAVGNKPATVSPLPMMAEQRKAKFAEQYGLDAESLTTGKPTTCSFALDGYPAHFAADGYVRNIQWHWATDAAKDKAAWWQVDLERPAQVARIVVVPYYAGNRYYGFTVQSSLDGKQWDTVADWTDNKRPATKAGYAIRFQPAEMRFIRVNLTSHSLNPGRHLVEVMAYGP